MQKTNLIYLQADEDEIAELIEERAEKVDEIKERYPYPEEA